MAVMTSRMTKFLCVTLLIMPSIGRAQCKPDDAGIYALFKQYREQVNIATQLDQLTPYFSTTFNNYYTDKLASATVKSRYLTHYWDNLNTAKDIVIVYEYAVQCAKTDEQATLTLLVILDQPLTPQQQIVDLWEVKVYYLMEGDAWLIDSFEYAKSHSGNTFEESQIVDNFAVIR